MGLSDPENAQITDEEFEGNVDPFFAECRAYGRVEEFYQRRPQRHEDDVIAVPCYGYLYVSECQVDMLREKFGIEDWNRPETEETERVKPIRALVKEFIPSEEPLDLKKRSVRRMVSDLRKLHGIGVHPRDVRARNYRGGLLVDFGSALTEPSCVLNVLPEWQVKAEKEGDLEAFDKMIKELGIRTSVRAAKFSDRRILTRSETAQQFKPTFMELDISGKKVRPAP